MTGMECLEASQFWPVSMFFIGTAILGYLIEKECKLGVVGLLRALVGLQNFTRTPLINVVHVASLVVPLGTWIWLARACLKLASVENS